MHQTINVFQVWGGPSLRKGAILAPLGRFVVPFWRPMGFEGSVRFVFLCIFGAFAKTKKHLHSVTTIPLKLENTKQGQPYTKRRSNPLGVCFSMFLAFSGLQRGENKIKNLVPTATQSILGFTVLRADRRHLLALAVENNHLQQGIGRIWQNLAESGGIIYLRKRANLNRTEVSQGATKIHQQIGTEKWLA